MARGSSIVSLLWNLAFIYITIKYLVPWGLEIAKEIPNLIPSGQSQQQQAPVDTAQTPVEEMPATEGTETEQAPEESSGDEESDGDKEESNFGTVLDRNYIPNNWV